MGSLSSLVGHYVHGYEPLAQWPGVKPNPLTRDAQHVDVDDRQFSERVSRKEDKDTKPFYDEESEQSDASSESESDDSSDSDSSSDSGSYDSDSDSSDTDSSSGSSSAVSSDASSESEEEVRKPLPLAKSSLSSVRKVGGGKKSLSGDALSAGAPVTAVVESTTAYRSPFDLNLLDFTSPSPVATMHAPQQEDLMSQQQLSHVHQQQMALLHQQQMAPQQQQMAPQGYSGQQG